MLEFRTHVWASSVVEKEGLRDRVRQNVETHPGFRPNAALDFIFAREIFYLCKHRLPKCFKKESGPPTEAISAGEVEIIEANCAPELRTDHAWPAVLRRVLLPAAGILRQAP